MSVNGINTANGVYESYAKQPAAAVANENAAKTADTLDESALNADTFEKSDAKTNVETGYDKLKRVARETVENYKSVQEENLKNLVSELLGKQAGVKSKKPNVTADLLSSVSRSSQVSGVEVSGETDWGIDAVATRIMDMAVSLSGGDSSKLETLRNAVTKGFEQAGVQFGKELPDISQNTYKEVMKRFDYWKENGSMDNYAYDASAYAAVEKTSKAE